MYNNNYNGRNYGRSSYQRNTQSNYRSQPKKRSGARFSVNRKTSEQVVVGWNASRKRGLLSVLITTSKFTEEFKGKKSGKMYTRLMAVLTNKTTGEQMVKNAYKSHANGKYYIPSLQMVVNPLAPNGGYFGQSKRPKNRY